MTTIKSKHKSLPLNDCLDICGGQFTFSPESQTFAIKKKLSGMSSSTSTTTPPGSPLMTRKQMKTILDETNIKELTTNTLVRLRRILLENRRYTLINALLLVVNEEDEHCLLTALLGLFEKNKCTMLLIEWMLQKELYVTPHINSLLRLDNKTVRLMKLYTKTDFVEYFKPFAKMLLQKCKKTLNDEGVQKAVGFLIDKLQNSVDLIPFKLRVVCCYIKQETEKKFPGSGLLGVSSFLFLRLMCPSITSPESKKDITEETKKNLINCGRTLQSLANFSNFSKDDDDVRTKFIAKQTPKIQTFLNDLAKCVLNEKAVAAKNPSEMIRVRRNTISSFEEIAIQEIPEKNELDTIFGIIKKHEVQFSKEISSKNHF